MGRQRDRRSGRIVDDLDVEHASSIALTSIVVRACGSKRAVYGERRRAPVLSEPQRQPYATLGISLKSG